MASPVPQAGVTLSMDIAAMADFHHKHDQFVILNVADDAVVTNPVTPEAAEFRALKRCSRSSRVFITGYSGSKK